MKTIIRTRKLQQHRGKDEGMILGLAWPPERGRAIIDVDPRQDERERLDTVVHEAIHLAMPWMKEEWVIISSAEISEILWKDKWRQRK